MILAIDSLQTATLAVAGLAPIASVIVGFALTRHLRNQDERLAAQGAKVDATHQAVNSRYDALQTQYDAAVTKITDLERTVAELVADRRVAAADQKADTRAAVLVADQRVADATTP